MEIKRKRGRPRKQFSTEEDEGKVPVIVTGTSSTLVRHPPEFFKLFLSDSNSQQLKLPKEFAREYGKSIKESSTIKDLCGNVWDVSVEKSKDGQVFFIGKEWEDFIKYHSLKNGYFLVFIYEGDSSFTVKVFSTNACKKSVPMAVEQTKGRDHVIFKY